MASLQLHVPPECSQKVFVPQFELKNKHIWGFIDAAGHCGFWATAFVVWDCVKCNPGSFFFLSRAFLISLISGPATEEAMRKNGDEVQRQKHAGSIPA